MASGASGAELANIVNEAALRAVRQGRTIVHEADLEESVEVVIAGYQKKNSVLSDQEKKVVAYHEIGHCTCFAADCSLTLHQFKKSRLFHVPLVLLATLCRLSRVTNI